MLALCSHISRFVAALGKFASIGILLMTFITFAIVVFRYGFGTGWIALQESVMYLHAIVFMLGAAYTLAEDGHVRVDIFYRQYSVRRKLCINLFGTVFFLFPVCIFILLISWDYVWSSWQLMESSTEAGGLPLVFVLKSLIPAMSILLMLQGIAQIGNAIAQLKKADLE